MRVFVFLFLIILLLPQSVWAKCYTNIEAEAEQGIRIHSELMVIGLNCQHMGKRYGMDLYGQYNAISARHQDLLERYEATLMSFFRRSGERNPEKALNTLRTNFANKISKNAAGMRPDVFCSRYAPRIPKVNSMSRSAFRNWAGTIYPSHPVSYPVCRAGR